MTPIFINYYFSSKILATTHVINLQLKAIAATKKEFSYCYNLKNFFNEVITVVIIHWRH